MSSFIRTLLAIPYKASHFSADVTPREQLRLTNRFAKAT